MYGVQLEQSRNGVGAFIPDVPGVAVVGENIADALNLLDEALQWHIDGLLQDGKPIPPPTPNSAIYKWRIFPQRLFLVQITAGLEFISISDGSTGPSAATFYDSKLRPQLEESSSSELHLVA